MVGIFIYTFLDLVDTDLENLPNTFQHVHQNAVELSDLKWDVLDIFEHKRKEESQLLLQSGEMFYWVCKDNVNQERIQFIFNKPYI